MPANPHEFFRLGGAAGGPDPAALHGLVGQADLVDCLFLVRNGVPLDVAFSLDTGERTAWVIVIGQMDGLTWDWAAMAWAPPG